MNNAMSYIKIGKTKGGNKVKKLSVILALALAVVMTMGISTAFAAGEEEATSVNFGTYSTTVNGEAYLNGMAPGTAIEPFGDTALNANGTGIGNLKKTETGQKVHGSYKVNSNSCASCHITHNAPGDKLLFKSTVYNTCTTCHDGTLGYLNVFQTGQEVKDALSTAEGSGVYDVSKMYAAGGGTFRVDALGKGNSMHLATGDLTNSAAPGGNRTGTDSKSWGQEFTCSSCHAPHGSYSSRLLHYNPNNLGNRDSDDAGVAYTVYNEDFAPLTADTDYVVYNYESTKYAVYSVKETGEDTGVFVADAKNTNPWLYGYTYGKPKAYWTKIWVDSNDNGTFEADEWKYSGDTSKAWVDVLHVNYKGAYFNDSEALIPAGVAIKIDVAPAMQVVFDKTGYDITGYGTKTGVSRFCAACHSDYNGQRGQGLEGTFEQMYRHTINRGATGGIPASDGGAQLECLSCHFAHGTSSDFQLNADNTFTTTVDINPSSALKRYVNQGVCVRCHTSSSASTLKNSDGYWDGDMYNLVYPTLD